MSELDDRQLIGEFAQTGSEPAFATLVERYVNLVYSTAFRFTHNAHHAEEIVQAVFVILARKAKTLSPDVILSGWLYQTARLTAANFLKQELRRRRREQEAFMQSTLDEPDGVAWAGIAPLLDEAMGRLREADRHAVVLRFFENKTAAEVAAALKVTEPAAQKRMSRAVEKLQKFFSKRGITSTAAAITGAISANSVQVAPPALAKTAITVALAKGAAASSSVITLAKGALKIMAWTKAKTALVIAGAALLVTTAVAPAVYHYQYYHVGPEAWRHRFEATYRLGDRDVIRYIRPPFIPERLQYYREESPDQAQAIPRGPDMLVLQQEGDELGLPSMAFGYRRHTLPQVLRDPLGFYQFELELPAAVSNLNLAGDWTIRTGATREELLKGLEPILQKVTGKPMRFEKRQVERDVIVAHGLAKGLDFQTRVQIYSENPQARGGGTGFGTVPKLLGTVGEQLNLYVVDETQAAEGVNFGWDYHDANASKMGARREELTEKVLKNLTDQTGLTFTREKRMVDVWFAVGSP